MSYLYNKSKEAAKAYIEYVILVGKKTPSYHQNFDDIADALFEEYNVDSYASDSTKVFVFTSLLEIKSNFPLLDVEVEKELMSKVSTLLKYLDKGK